MTEQKHKTWAFTVVKYQLIQCPILLQPFPAQRWSEFQLNKKLRIQMKHVLSINIHKPNRKTNFEVKCFIVCVSSVEVKSIFISQIYLQIFTQRLTTSTVTSIGWWPCMISSLYGIWLNWPYYNSALIAACLYSINSIWLNIKYSLIVSYSHPVPFNYNL